MSSQTFSIDGADLHYELAGDPDGPPLLLLHGTTGCTADWAHAGRDLLAAQHRLILLDARGHGRSTGWDAPITYRRCARDVLALLDHLGLARCQAIGLSMGGNTLLHVATIEPARLDAMVLASATMSFPPGAQAIMRAGVPIDVALRARCAHGDAQARALAALPRAWADDPGDLCFTAGDLAAITARTLIVAGDRDPLYPVSMAVAMYEAIRDAALWVVPGGGHCPVFVERAAAFAATSLAFLTGAGPR